MALNVLLSDPYFDAGERFGRSLAYFAVAALGVWLPIRITRKKKKNK